MTLDLWDSLSRLSRQARLPRRLGDRLESLSYMWACLPRRESLSYILVYLSRLSCMGWWVSPLPRGQGLSMTLDLWDSLSRLCPDRRAFPGA